MSELPPLPDDAIAVADGLRHGLDRILGDSFASLFLYGAIAFPRPENWSIDFDFHVLLHQPLDDAQRQRIAVLYAELAAASPLGADLDGYYVLLADASRPEPPQHQLDLRMRDDVWALHCAHVHAGRYFPIVGIDPRGVVPEPAWETLQAALRAELQFVETHPDATAFGILNSARILYSFESRDVVVSKYHAAQWALGSVPDQWHDAINAAVRWYSHNANDADTRTLAAARAPFVAFVRKSIGVR